MVVTLLLLVLLLLGTLVLIRSLVCDKHIVDREESPLRVAGREETE